ncbi:hypothetical protein CR513_13654, partial [Mucuna pruriens]
MCFWIDFFGLDDMWVLLLMLRSSRKTLPYQITIATGDDLVILRDFVSINFVSDESMWIIDSSATLHVTPRKEFFTSYTVGDFEVLKIGNDGVTKTKDKRSKLDMKTRYCIFIGYGLDEYGYMMYDPVEKKLVPPDGFDVPLDDDAEGNKRCHKMRIWSADMMTKVVPRGKFEACCDIVGLALPPHSCEERNMLG